TKWPKYHKRAGGPRRGDKTASDPGKPHWGDAFGLLVYVGGFVFCRLLVVCSIPGVSGFRGQAYGYPPIRFHDVVAEEPIPSWFLMYSNVVLYSITGIIMLAISWRPFIYSLRWFATWWWVKVLLLPVVWLGTLLLTTLLLVISGHESSVSANQEAVEQ